MNKQEGNKELKPLPADIVHHMAQLSRLVLTDSETEKFARQFASILDYMAVLEKVDTDGVEPLYTCVFQKAEDRKDEAINRRTREEILANAPETDGECFIVPRII